MKPVKVIFILIFSLLTSCYKVYDPKIDTDQKVLVVDGVITNKTEAYNVILFWARPFNSSEKGIPVIGANVSVTDDHGNSFLFTEIGKGVYVSDYLQFTGHPGHTYRLHIITPDEVEYESDPQRMFPEVSPEKVYAEFGTKETLEKYTGLKVNTHGANILLDIRNESDSIPRFRIASNLVNQYYYFDYNLDLQIHFDYYCWQTVNVNPNFNITGGEYSLNSASIRRHSSCFLDDNLYVFVPYYSSRINKADSTASARSDPYYYLAENHGRILYLNMYTLNKESYLYYKSLQQQIQSEEKLFDPIAAQLNGNIKCISDPEKRAIGFFEASSVNNSRYVVDFRNLSNSQPSLIKTPYILPPEPNGCRINGAGTRHYKIPSFWIFN
jgi:hypothetical protein